MRVFWVSTIGRLSATALLLQAGIPFAAVLADGRAFRNTGAAIPKKDVAEGGRSATGVASVNRPSSKELKPVPPGRATRSAPVIPTLLDERAYLRRNVTGYDAERWRRKLTTHLAPSKEARLRIQLGEFELGRSEPERAQYHLKRAIPLVPASNPDRGLASYDMALCLFLEGRFPEARHEFRRIIAAPLRGFDRKNAAMYAQHASACATYHAANRALGIPQPTKLDPLCGAASLAVASRELGLRYEKGFVVSRVKHSGEGSSLQNLIDALPGLGLSGKVVNVDKQGLIASPVPLVAFVERDHFVTVVDADQDGVEYVCSDCGRWPGGPVRLTWKQWKAMDASIFLAVARANSPESLALVNLPAKKGVHRSPLRLASRGDASVVAKAERRLKSMEDHFLTVTWPYPRFLPVFCGMRGRTLHCTFQSCPKFCKPCLPGASFEGDPVNLATGEEEYGPISDLSVRNLKGPSINWSRTYNSLANTSPSGFGSGWSHSYNWRIERMLANGVWKTELVMPNSARLTVATNETSPPTSAAPTKAASFEPGVPMRVEWKYGGSKYYTITFKDRTKWTFAQETSVSTASFVTDPSAIFNFYYPVQIDDRFGNAIYLNWTPQNFAQPDPTTGSTSLLALREISNEEGPLFRVHYASGGRIDYVAELSPYTTTTRGVRYQVEPLANQNVPGPLQTQDELTRVSFVKAATRDAYYNVTSVAAASSSERFVYGYSNITNLEAPDPQAPDTYELIPTLTSISVPNPSMTASGLWDGMSRTTTTLQYNSDASVRSITDGHGYVTNFAVITDAQGNAVKTKVYTQNNSAGNAVRTLIYYASWDSAMSATRTDYVASGSGASEILFTPSVSSYGATTSPWMPQSVTDGNGHTWQMTWDQYGNALTSVSPKGITTTNSVDYTDFPLGQTTSSVTGNLAPTGFSYFSNGAIQSVTGAIPYRSGASGTQSVTYGVRTAMGNPTSVTAPGNSTAATRTISFGYSPSEYYGLPMSVTDAAGKSETYTYDYRGNVLNAKDRDGNVTSFEYNEANQVTRVWLPKSGQNGTGRSSQVYTYLYFGGPLSAVRSFSESGVLSSNTDYFLGVEGELLTRRGTGEYASYYYDSSYRPVTIRTGTPGNFDGPGTEVTYDTAGRTIRVKGPANTGTTADAHRKDYTYDPAGNLKTIYDGRGFGTLYTYGDLDGGLTSIEYLTAGPVSSTPLGIKYRATGTTATHPLGGAYNVSIGYDDYDRTTNVSDGTGSATYTYDDLGNVKSEARAYAGVPSAKTFNYEYNPDGSGLAMSVDGYAWSYAYNGLGRFASLTSPAGVSAAAYTNGGSLLSTGLPNGSYTNYGYKVGNGSTGLGTGLLGSQGNYKAGGATNGTYALTYNSQLALASLSATIPASTPLGGNTAYTYSDPTSGKSYTLVRENSARNGGYDYAHTYDSTLSINLLTLRGDSQANSFYPNDIPNVTGTLYDNDGNFAQNGVAHDVAGRMVTGPVANWNATYRADNLRAMKRVNGVSTYFYYDLAGDPVLETDASGNVKSINVFDPEGLVARKDVATGASTYYQFDPQGNVAQAASATGAVLNSRAYDAFGKELSVRNGSSVTTASDPFGFNARSGYYLDRETGIYYCQNRYYDPSRARWLEKDPIGFAGGMNQYAYCAAQPVGRIDKSGLQMMDEEEQRESIAGGWHGGGGGGGGGLAGNFNRSISRGISNFNENVSRLTALEGEANVACYGTGVPSVVRNRASGLSAQSAVMEDLIAFGVDARPARGVRVPGLGMRFPDIAVWNNGRISCYIEVKQGNSWYGGRQLQKDQWIGRSLDTSTWLWRVP